MSEELKQKAREFLREHAPEYKYQCVLLHGMSVELSLAMAEFAFQVCEQREKEGIATIQAAGFEINPPETLHGAICQILQVWMSWKDAAEAAELALQSRDKRISELGADICNMNDSIAEIVCQDLADWDWKTCLERVKNLRAALQAKERELPCGHPAANLETISIGSGEFNTFCNFCLQIDNERKEARQQAIAECAALFHAPEIKQRILGSLTPPPALTCKHLERWEHANGMICKGCGATL